MPLLLLVSLYEFRQFLNIVLWIAVPATLIAILVTVVLHYRRKKSQPAPDAAFSETGGWQALMAEPGENLPDWLASADPDNTTLLKKYEREIRRYRENYTTLEQEFRELEEKYTDLRNKAYTTNREEDTSLVKQLQQELKAYKEKVNRLQHAAIDTEGVENDSLLTMQSTIQQLQEELRIQQQEKEHHAAEIDKLEQLLKSMEQSVTAAREEASRVQQHYVQQVEEMGRENLRLQQLAADSPVAEGAAAENGEQVQHLQQLLAQAEVEVKTLKDKLYEQDYLPDVLEEKKLQIDFLQNQLEYRIKSHHTLEQQAREAAAQLQQLQATVTGLDEQARRLTGEAGQQHEVIRTKTSHIEHLEKQVADMQEQQALLHTEIADQRDAVRSLEEHLAYEQQKSKTLEIKLEQSSRLLNRVYAVLARSLENEVPGKALELEASA